MKPNNKTNTHEPNAKKGTINNSFEAFCVFISTPIPYFPSLREPLS